VPEVIRTWAITLQWPRAISPPSSVRCVLRSISRRCSASTLRSESGGMASCGRTSHSIAMRPSGRRTPLKPTHSVVGWPPG
jgi:hypothetical protein